MNISIENGSVLIRATNMTLVTPEGARQIADQLCVAAQAAQESWPICEMCLTAVNPDNACHLGGGTQCARCIKAARLWEAKVKSETRAGNPAPDRRMK